MNEDEPTAEEVAAAEAVAAEEAKNKGGPDLRAALERLKQEKADLAKRLKGIEDAQATKEAEEAARRGEFEDLYKTASADRDTFKAERDELKSREEARTKALDASNTTRLEALPEHLRTLVPSGLDADATARQITGLEKLAATEARPAGSRRTAGGSKGITAEQKAAAEAFASRNNLTVEYVLDNVSGPWSKAP